MWKLHVEHRRLHGIEATVEACVDIVVTPVGAVVGERTYCSGQFSVGGGYGAGVAHAADVFGRIEAEGGGVAEGAGGSRAVQAIIDRDGPDGLGVVLDYEQIVASGRAHERIVETYASVEMHGHYGARAWSDQFFQLQRVEVGGQCIGFGEHGNKACVGYGKNRGDICVGRNYHLVGRPQTAKPDIAQKNQAQGVQAVAYAYGKVRSGDVAQPRLEFIHFRAAHIAAAGHNIGQSRRDFVGIRRVDGGKIEKRVTCSGIHWQWMGMWVRALARCWP